MYDYSLQIFRPKKIFTYYSLRLQLYTQVDTYIYRLQVYTNIYTQIQTYIYS